MQSDLEWGGIVRRTLGAVLVYDSGAKAYWNAQIPTSSTPTPGSGVRIDILSVSADRTTHKVRVP